MAGGPVTDPAGTDPAGSDPAGSDPAGSGAKGTGAKGTAAAEIARGFFGVQLLYADALAARAGMAVADAITWHTNFHRLFAYGNLGKMAPDPDFLALARQTAAIADHDQRLECLMAAYAARPFDGWPRERFPFGKHFACEAPDSAGIVRIHFRNRANTDAIGPLDAANYPQRRADLGAMFGFIAERWPDTRAIEGASWLYNLEAYRRLFPPAYANSRTPRIGPRPTHGLSTWGQFLDYRGALKANVAAPFIDNLQQLDPAEPWRVFPYNVLATHAPFAAFREEYGL